MGKYHLPPGETLVEELQCLVVYTPADPVYRQALWGAISQLTKFWIWEPDGQGGEHDAADSWDLAYEATLESFGMLDQLLEAVDEVEPLLRALQDIAQPCCDSDESDGSLFTDDVEDGTGNVPQNIIDAGYATDANDWAGFDEYKCMIAHVAIDDMEGKLRKFAPYVDAAGTVAGGVAAIIGIITTIFTSGASALVGGILASTAAAATLYKNATSGVFLTSLADKVAANHEDLACAIYVGTDGPTAACAALDSEIDALFTATESLILKNLNTCAGIRAFYGGRHDLQNVAQTLADKGYVVGDFDCTCSDVTEWFFASSLEGWVETDSDEPLEWVSDDGDPNLGCIKLTPLNQFPKARSPAFSVSGPADIQIQLRVKKLSGVGTSMQVVLRDASDDSLVESLSDNVSTTGVWQSKTKGPITAVPSGNYYVVVQTGFTSRVDTVVVTIS